MYEQTRKRRSLWCIPTIICRRRLASLQQENEWLRLRAKGRQLECEELRQYAGELIDPDGNHDILCCAIVYFKDLKEGNSTIED